MNQYHQPVTDAAKAGTRALGTILIIDDDAAVGLVLTRALARLGHIADFASDGRRGTALFDAEPSRYSLVLLDFKLPGMDSAEVFGRIRERSRDVPVVLMSGHSREDAIRESEGLNYAGFLKKPFTVDTLRAAVALASG